MFTFKNYVFVIPHELIYVVKLMNSKSQLVIKIGIMCFTLVKLLYVIIIKLMKITLCTLYYNTITVVTCCVWKNGRVK